MVDINSSKLQAPSDSIYNSTKNNVNRGEYTVPISVCVCHYCVLIG